jgi:uncharacterized protein (DUF2062 family)
MVLMIIVTMSVGACECCVFWAFVPLWIAQMITGLILCVFIRGTLLFWVSTLCFVSVFVRSSSRTP